MKAESMQSPVSKYKITAKDKYNVEVEFFANIQEKQKKQDNLEELITVYEYNYYRITIRNRPNLSEQLENNYDEWLQYAISLDPSEYVPSTLEIVQSQYKEYEGMDTPSTIEEMKLQDPAMAEEYIGMMIELRGLIYTLSAQESQPVGYALINIPTPSEKLKKFKNRFKKI